MLSDVSLGLPPRWYLPTFAQTPGILSSLSESMVFIDPTQVYVSVYSRLTSSPLIKAEGAVFRVRQTARADMIRWGL